MAFISNKIVVQTKSVLSQNQSTKMEIGYIDENGYLFNITNSLSTFIAVVEGNVVINSTGGDLFIVPYSLGTIILKITYESTIYYVSLWSVTQALYPQINDLTKVIQKYLPPTCYDGTTSYTKCYGVASVVAEFYNFLYQSFQNIYPPFSTDTSWEQMLNNGVSWEGSFDYGMVIQILNNVPEFNANVYNTTYQIAEYIYARIGEMYFVYLEETYSNPSNSWVLGHSQLGVNTTLATPYTDNNVIIHVQTTSLPSGFQEELVFFAQKILTPDIAVIVDLDPDFSVFGLLVNISDTYDLDPRLYSPYALQYNPETVYNVSALITPYNPYFLTSYYIFPSSQSFLPSDGSFPITATAVFTYDSINYEIDVTNKSTFTSDNNSVIRMFGNIGAIEGIGVAHVEAIYLDQRAEGTYNVQTTLWSLGFSQLGTNTTIG